MRARLREKKGNMRTDEDSKNRTVTGQTNRTDKPSRAAKTHQDYWKAKLKRRSYIGRDGKTVEIPEWQVRMFHRGREGWFNLGTANQAAAAVKARNVYLSLVSAGWEVTVAKFKPEPFRRAVVCTVGEFLANVKARSHLRPRTLKIYATKLRKMVADIARVEAGIGRKARRAKHDYVNGGREVWLAKVDGQRLDVLTPESVNTWRNAYAVKAGADPVKRKSAERTAASCIRCSRALFSPDVVRVLKVKLPANPFAGVKLKDPGPQRYHSEVNPEWLLVCAERELRAEQPQLYLGLFLCLWAGLRRKEADLLTWGQIDFEAGQIHIRRTPYFEPKTEESQRDIDLAPAAVEVLRALKADSKSEFALDGGEPDPSATWPYYRANVTWRKLIAWLKDKGVSQRNAVHTLRKESGSLIASTFGIEAARQHLGHRDIRTTSSTYVTKKRRVEVSLPLGAAEQLQIVGEK
jgi:integrase